MHDAVRDQYEAFPDPSPAAEPIGPGQLDRIDDSLHYGWSWHRYRYCFRRNDAIKALDAGCGTGLSTLGLARLNAGAKVRGVDVSPRSLELARERAKASGIDGAEFFEHDLEQPLPGDWGPFDFIVCRRVLGQVDDPVRVLANLARSLDPKGLLFVTLPTRVGRQPVRQMRLAIDALAGPDAPLAEREKVGRALFQILRPDHPIRRDWAAQAGGVMPGPERFIARYLNVAERDNDLPEAIATLERAGLQFLFTSTRLPWQAGRVLTGQGVTDDLKARVDGLSQRRMSELIDALDPALHGDEYRIYACLAEYEPRLPTWPEPGDDRPESIDGLIPHRTGLTRPIESAQVANSGRVSYISVTGAVGELEAAADLAFRAVDGRSTCGEIDQRLAAQTGLRDDPQTTRTRWVQLADHGFVILESPDVRQYVDCVHLGRILDRLDCACPRRWLRACELHEFCTISTVNAESPTYPALREARERLAAEHLTSCAECSDYVPEE